MSFEDINATQFAATVFFLSPCFCICRFWLRNCFWLLQDEHPGVDRRLDFGDALDALRAWNDDEVCDEFLQAMVDGPGAEPAWGEQDTQEASSECKPLFHELKKTDNLFVGVAEYLKPETSNSGSISPSISEFSDAVSMLEDWASGSDSATGPDSHPARDALQDAREIPD